MAKATKTAKEETVQLRRINAQSVKVTIRGITPLIMHKWSEKAKKQIRDKQMGKAQKKKDPKDPQADFEAAHYHFDDGRLGIPCLAIKKACVAAVRFIDGFPMTQARGAFFIVGEYSKDAGYPLVEITSYDEIVRREDPVTIGRGGTDLRYRPEVRGWRAQVEVELYGNVLTVEQFINLLDMAGHMVGLLEWRPEKNGDFGRFEVVEG